MKTENKTAPFAIVSTSGVVISTYADKRDMIVDHMQTESQNGNYTAQWDGQSYQPLPVNPYGA